MILTVVFSSEDCAINMQEIILSSINIEQVSIINEITETSTPATRSIIQNVFQNSFAQSFSQFQRSGISQSVVEVSD